MQYTELYNIVEKSIKDELEEDYKREYKKLVSDKYVKERFKRELDFNVINITTILNRTEFDKSPVAISNIDNNLIKELLYQNDYDEEGSITIGFVNEEDKEIIDEIQKHISDILDSEDKNNIVFSYLNESKKAMIIHDNNSGKTLIPIIISAGTDEKETNLFISFIESDNLIGMILETISNLISYNMEPPSDADPSDVFKERGYETYIKDEYNEIYEMLTGQRINNSVEEMAVDLARDNYKFRLMDDEGLSEEEAEKIIDEKEFTYDDISIYYDMVCEDIMSVLGEAQLITGETQTMLYSLPDDFDINYDDLINYNYNILSSRAIEDKNVNFAKKLYDINKKESVVIEEGGFFTYKGEDIIQIITNNDKLINNLRKEITRNKQLYDIQDIIRISKFTFIYDNGSEEHYLVGTTPTIITETALQIINNIC